MHWLFSQHLIVLPRVTGVARNVGAIVPPMCQRQVSVPALTHDQGNYRPTTKGIDVIRLESCHASSIQRGLKRSM
jgi:hypothetical protein